MNIAMLAEMAAQGDADRIALGDSRGGMSYGVLWDRCARAASWLAGKEARNVAFLGVSSAVFPIALFGAAQADRPFAPLNYRWSRDQLLRAVRRLTPVVVIADAEFDSLAAELAELDGIEVVGAQRFRAELARAAPCTEGVGEPSEPAALLFTSGTSGEPKVAVLGHHNLSSYILGTVDFLEADAGEAQLVSVPPYHVGGIANLLSSLYRGRRIVQLPTFAPLEWIAAVESQRITHAMVVPTMLARILDVLADHPAPRLPSLRHLSYGGGRMPLPVVNEAMRLLPDVGFVNGYGLTETSSTITVLGPEDHWSSASSDDPAVRRRLGSVGRPLPSVEVSIRGEEGNPLPPGELGELWVRGEQISGEYEGTGSARDGEGWFHTKDAASMDEDGYIFIEGRLDDVIVRGGENMSPGEIEDALLSHPGVADAGVIGLPDDDWGEQVVAAVVLLEYGTPAPDDLREWVRARLRSAKTPARIEVVEQLPYNDNGKLLRRQLRAELGA